MIYKSNDKVYIFANNKYYELRVDKDNLVPAEKAIYELKPKYEISYQDAMKLLKGNSRNKRFESEID